MNLEAEKSLVIEQVSSVQDAELMSQLRRLFEEAVQEFGHKHASHPPMHSEAELSARLDAADDDIKHGRVLTNDEAVAHLRHYAKL